MVSRRSFVGSSSLALLGAACAPGTGEGGGVGQAGSLPPSIAALTSMKSRATPISVDERKARIEKARRLMVDNQIDALILAGGTSLVYFTGMNWGNSERFTGVIIPARGAPFIVTPKFEEERTIEQVKLGPLGEGTDVLTWEEHENPHVRVAQGLKSRGIVTGRLGIEETVKWVFSDMAGQALPAMRLTSGTPVTAGCRMLKDAHELELMKLASLVTLKAYQAAYKAMNAGMTQNDFAQLVSLAHDRLGFSGGAGVQVGVWSANPHGSITPQTIEEGSILLIDGGCRVEGYSSDLSRTFVLGKPTDRMKKVFDVEYAAQTAALAAARPGVPCGDIDAAARKVIVDAGFGPGYTYFSHRVVNVLAMDGHECPYLVK